MDSTNNSQITYRISELIEKLRKLQENGNIKEISQNLNKLNNLFQYFMSSNPKEQKNINRFKENLNKINAKYNNQVSQQYPNLPEAGTHPILPAAGTHPVLPAAGTHPVNVKKGMAWSNPVLKRLLNLSSILDEMSNSDLIKNVIKYNGGLPRAGRKPLNYLDVKKDNLKNLYNIIKHQLNEIIYKGDMTKIKGKVVSNILFHQNKIIPILENIRRGELEMNVNKKINVTVKKIYLFDQIKKLVKETSELIKELDNLRKQVI